MSYGSPTETLGTWQAHLCHDDPAGEYACLSAALKREMGGFETYHAARRKLMDEEPLFAFFLKRVDLAGRAQALLVADDGRSASLSLEADGRSYAIDFVQEVWAIVELEGEAPIVGRLDVPLADIIRRQAGRQWIELSRPRLDGADLDAVQSVLIERRWKIDAIGGLTLDPRVTP